MQLPGLVNGVKEPFLLAIIKPAPGLNPCAFLSATFERQPQGKKGAAIDYTFKKYKQRVRPVNSIVKLKQLYGSYTIRNQVKIN